MKKSTLLLAVCLAIMTSAFANADDNVPPKTHPDSSKWQDMFTPGLDDAIFPKGVWTFKDGVLAATKDQCIWTKKHYENCVIDIEFKTAEGTNSGVIIYCSDMTELSQFSQCEIPVFLVPLLIRTNLAY